MTTIEFLSLLVAVGAAWAAWRSAGSSKRSADAASKTAEAAVRSAGSGERMVAAVERAEEGRVIENLVPLLEHDVKIPQVRAALGALPEPFRSRWDEILARAIAKVGKVAAWRDAPEVKVHLLACWERLDRMATGGDLLGERPVGTVTR